jgi:hypothetical protein
MVVTVIVAVVVAVIVAVDVDVIGPVIAHLNGNDTVGVIARVDSQGSIVLSRSTRLAWPLGMR